MVFWPDRRFTRWSIIRWERRRHRLSSPGNSAQTIEIKISYLASVRSGKVHAETEVVRQGRQIVFLESKVRDETGKLVATASGSFIVMSIPGPSAPARG